MEQRANVIIQSIEGSGTTGNQWFINLGMGQDRGGPEIVINKELEFDQWVKQNEIKTAKEAEPIAQKVTGHAQHDAATSPGQRSANLVSPGTRYMSPIISGNFDPSSGLSCGGVSPQDSPIVKRNRGYLPGATFNDSSQPATEHPSTVQYEWTPGGRNLDIQTTIFNHGG